MSARQERDWRLYADDILQACAKVRHIVSGMTYEKFVGDEIRVDATLRNIEIIGEDTSAFPCASCETPRRPRSCRSRTPSDGCRRNGLASMGARAVPNPCAPHVPRPCTTGRDGPGRQGR